MKARVGDAGLAAPARTGQSCRLQPAASAAAQPPRPSIHSGERRTAAGLPSKAVGTGCRRRGALLAPRCAGLGDQVTIDKHFLLRQAGRARWGPGTEEPLPAAFGRGRKLVRASCLAKPSAAVGLGLSLPPGLFPRPRQEPQEPSRLRSIAPVCPRLH